MSEPRVLPFHGLRYSPAIVGELSSVVCPPYDVIGPAERERLGRQSAYNAVHVELPADVPSQPGTRYREAATLLAAWEQAGALVPEATPAYYLHETRFSLDGQPHARRDVIAAVGLEPWDAGVVLPHERTMAGPKADRLALMRATRANVSPVWLLHRNTLPALERAWTESAARPADVTASLGEAEHHIWAVTTPDLVNAIRDQFKTAGPLYIADGHHRYETALAYQREVDDAVPGADAALAVVTLASDPGLLVLPTHRLLSALPTGTTLEGLRQTWSALFEVEPCEGSFDDCLRRLEANGEPETAFGVLGPGDAFTLLRLKDPASAAARLPGERSEAWKRLDVAQLHTLVVDPLVEQTGAPRDDVLSYTRDAEEAREAVRNGAARMAFFLNATRVDQVLDVADAGDRMPEKSTYFFPKPPTGLVLRDLTRD